MNCLYASHIHKDYLFIMHSCILLNLYVTPPLLSKMGCLDCRNILQCSQESQHGGAILLYLELVLSVLSFYVYKAEVMYMFKQSSIILKLLCPHTDIFCINNYRCSDYYHFLQVDQYIQLFCKGVRYYIMRAPNPRRS